MNDKLRKFMAEFRRKQPKPTAQGDGWPTPRLRLFNGKIQQLWVPNGSPLAGYFCGGNGEWRDIPEVRET